MKIYNLYIDSHNEATHRKITELFGFSSADSDLNTWTYQLREKDEDEYVDFTKIFEDLLTPNMKALNKIGVTSNDMSIWVVYEYFRQCSLGFSSLELQRISNLNVPLSIDCHEVNHST